MAQVDSQDPNEIQEADTPLFDSDKDVNLRLERDVLLNQLVQLHIQELLLVVVVEIRMKSAAAGKTRFFDPPRMIFAA